MAARVNPVERAGRRSPPGATILLSGVSFSVFSRAAPGAELSLLTGKAIPPWYLEAVPSERGGVS